MNLIILSDHDRIDSDRYRLADERAEHIREVLKLTYGDRCEVGLVDGPVGRALIETSSEEGVEVCFDQQSPARIPQPTVDLVCALPRPQTLKRVLATAATMGIRTLHLIRANRVEKSYYASPLMQPENYTPFLIEGLSQGKLTRLPKVLIYERFRPFFEDVVESEYPVSDSWSRITAAPEGEGFIDSVVAPSVAGVLLAIGPEGGWVPFELELMRIHGFRLFTLGDSILRVEAAVVAALAQLALVTAPHRR